MPQHTTSQAVRVSDGRTLSLHPTTSVLSSRTHAMLRALAKERHAPNCVQRADRPHRLG